MPANYAYYLFVGDWPELAVAVNELEYRLRTAGRPVAADMLLKSYGELRDEMLALAQRMSVFGTETLRATEKETHVRPDTEGHGGNRLGDALVSEPIGNQSLVPGSVGVANEELLDKEVPWWLTNETGSTANVGRLLFGFFYGGDDDAPPDMSEFRVHPLFQAGASPVSGGGVIKHATPARRFIAKSVPQIDSEWKVGFNSARGRFEAQMARALATRR